MMRYPFRKAVVYLLISVMLVQLCACGTVKDAFGKEDREETKVTKEHKDLKTPNYVPGKEPDYVTKEFNWKTNDGKHKMNVTLEIDKNMYDYFRSLKRSLTPFDGHMALYITEENNLAILEDIAGQIKSRCEELGYDDRRTLMEVINFVQSLDYVLDSDSRDVEDYSKYPIETLYDESGDCEDTSILLAGLAKAMGYDVIYIWYLSGHMAVGIYTEDYDGKYFEYEGRNYFYIETTGEGWEIGEEPEFNAVEVKYILSTDPEDY